MKKILLLTFFFSSIILTAQCSYPCLHTAFSFNGSQYLKINNVGNFITTIPFTVEAWIKTSGSTVRPIILSDYGNGWALGLNANTQISLSKNGTNEVLCAGVISPNVWHHIAVSYNGTVAKFYIDGLSAGQQNYAETFSNGTNGHFVIGGAGTQGPYFFTGDIDEIRVWGTERTISEIVATKDIELVGNEPGLLLYYNFNETSGTVADNLAGTSYNATMQSGTINSVNSAPLYCSANYTWTGNNGTSWDNPANWTPNGIPNNTGDVATVPDVANDPVIYSSINIGQFTLNANASLTINTGALLNPGFTDINGTININGAGNLTGSLHINSSGSIICYGNIYLSAPSYSAGSILINPTGNFNFASLNNLGTLTVNGTVNHSNGPFYNSGSGDIIINSGGILSSSLLINEFTSSIIINTGGSLVMSGELANISLSNIVVESGGSLKLSTYQANGGSTFTVKRQGTSSASKYNYWSSPVTSGSLPGNNGYYYNPSSGTNGSGDDNPGDGTFDPGWQSFSGTMAVGKGYASKGGGLATFTGVPNSGSINVNVTTSGQSSTSLNTPSYFNLIGNPYTCGFSASHFYGRNAGLIDYAFYFWYDDNSNGTGYSSSDYAVRTGAGGIAASSGGPVPDDNIGSCQGFFVKANSNTTLLFDAAGLRTDNDIFFKTEEEISRLWLNLYNDTLYNEILIAFASDATENHDGFYDAMKRRGNADISFAAIQEQEAYCIAAFPPVISERIIPLSVSVSNEGVYNISIKEIESLSNVNLYLEDRLEGTFTNLLQNNTYSAFMNAQNTDDRFFLHFTPLATLTTETIGHSLLAYTSHEELIVNFSGMNEKSGTISITDMDGRELLRQQHVNMEATIFHTNVSALSAGIYIVSLQTESNIYSNKIAVK